MQGRRQEFGPTTFVAPLGGRIFLIEIVGRKELPFTSYFSAHRAECPYELIPFTLFYAVNRWLGTERELRPECAVQ